MKQLYDETARTYAQCAPSQTKASLLNRYAAFDDEHRPSTHVCLGAQQTPEQQTVFGPHAVLAQHVSFTLGAQNGALVPVMQHFLPFTQQRPLLPHFVYPAGQVWGFAS